MNRRIILFAFAVLLAAGTAGVVHRPFASAAANVTVPSSPNKYALLVGISKYNRNSQDADGSPKPDLDWWDLHTKGDLEILAEALIRKFQFKPENIRVVCDESVKVGDKEIPPTKPTAKAIEDAFRSALTDKAQKGDIVYFHYSGHGSQAPDDDKNGPNPVVGDEADGLDETLIPADYRSQDDRSGDIRDDSITKWLEALNKKDPANVTVTLDSCHSGTATRGDEVRRGAPWRGKIDPKLLAKRDDSSADFVSRGGDAGRQNYVFISAASPTQTSKEQIVDGVHYGKFTYGLAKAMDKAGATTTYRDLFESVFNAMTRQQRDQTPQIEGRRLDQVVMGVGAVPTQPFVGVQTSGGRISLKAGKLQGVTKGSTFALYPEGAKSHEEGKQIVKARVEKVNPLTATLSLVGTATPEKLKTAVRAFEIEHSYDESLKVAIDDTTRGGTELNGVFTALGLAERVPRSAPDWNVLIRREEADGPEFKNAMAKPGFKGYVLERRDGSIIRTIEDGPAAVASIREALDGEARWLLVKSLNDTANPALANKVQLSLVQVDVDFDEDAGELIGMSEAKTPPTERGGKRELRAFATDTVAAAGGDEKRYRPGSGDWVTLEIKNTGDQPVWVTVLNLRSDGRIGPAFPLDNADNEIAPGKTLRLDYAFRITAPYGEESFTAIVTTKATDFTPLIHPDLRTRGPESERGKTASESPLGKMLRMAGEGKRGDPTAPPAAWATTSVMYVVVRPDTK